MQEIKKAIQSLAQGVQFDISRPEEKFGDYATNIAMKMAARNKSNPREIAEKLAPQIEQKLGDKVTKVEIAAPGFINIRLSDKMLKGLISKKPDQFLKDQTIVIEHTDPNPFKEFHIGHAYSNTVGEALGRLLQTAGATVHQVSYHGDAGLHIAMAIWGMKQLKAPGNAEKHEYLAKSYALGAKANKDDNKAAEEIREINKHIYVRDDEEINKLYDEGRKWSFDYFDEIYKKLGVEFDDQYFETETGKIGKEIVEKHFKVFERSDEAIIYRGEKKGLHTRVFITREGLPTYEAKELGLTYEKQKDYPDASTFLVVTANEIDEYFKVLIAALEDIEPKLAAKIKHVSHGLVKLPSGKMSSRTGDVITLNQVLEMLEKAAKKVAKDPQSVEAAVLGALKYGFLKHRIGGDIVFDVQESVSIEGNSGPYLQYAYARAHSIVKDLPKENVTNYEYDTEERTLARKISEFPEVVELAVRELAPSHVCTYLHELAQTFNHFYESSRVRNDERQSWRVKLISDYIGVLETGLNLLNIPAPEKM